MRSGLGIAGLTDLVELPLVATLATYRRDGTVLLSPVWHEWRDGGFNVVTEESDIKARSIRRDPRAALVLYDSEPPYRGVEIRSTARLISDGAQEAQLRLAIRYLGLERGASYAAKTRDLDVIIRLEPGDLRTWDFADYEW